MKPQPEDIIWNTLTASARIQFDNKAFRKEFGPLDNERILDTMLFQILEGFAEGESAQKIAEHISHDLQMLKYTFAGQDFEPFIALQKTNFAKEIEATTLALTLFGEGKEIPWILNQVARFVLRLHSPRPSKHPFHQSCELYRGAPRLKASCRRLRNVYRLHSG